ncbi:MAG: orotate phosphoribosyltransferase [Rhodospirillales bacterium]|nr:orotate phosphoribosyltransferase [Rhodospirillales bacterium]
MSSSLYGPEAAKILLDIKAVNFRPEEPYILTSGWASPVYIDCRKLISYPKERKRMMEMAVDVLQANGALDGLDAVAGGETAGIPYAAWIADSTGQPMLYVRKKPKGFGRNAQIEGDMAEGSKVLLVEDLATDGASKITFINALRDAGGKVTDSFVVFFYGVFSGAEKTLEDEGVKLHYLATWHDVLSVAEEGKYFPPEAIEGVRAFLKDPAAWSAAHGGKSG